MTRILLPANAAAFDKLRTEAARVAGRAPAPTSTSSIVQGPKTPEDPRPRPTAPARIPEKPKDDVPELEPELDLVDLFHGARK